MRKPLLFLAIALSIFATQCRAELLSRSEGEAVVDTAMRYGQSLRGEDCSHLAHDVYQRAGLPYDYASSTSLYNGDPAFERVTRPQPGDLVVWRGHVGIVVNPQDGTFYSSLSSGPGTDSYESRYWLSRGPARFYRYDGSENHTSQTVTARGTRPQSPSASRGKKTGGVLARAIGSLVWHSGKPQHFARSAAISIAPTLYIRAR
jgi:hypothetical protein